MCDVLEEMRKCDKTKNYAYLLSLIEEVQSMANRMEAALADTKDIKNLQEEISKMKKEIKTLEAKKKKLGGKTKKKKLRRFEVV